MNDTLLLITNIQYRYVYWDIKKIGLSLEIDIGYIYKLMTRFPKTNTLREGGKKTFPFNGVVLLSINTTEQKQTKKKNTFYSSTLTLEKTTNTLEDSMVFLYL